MSYYGIDWEGPVPDDNDENIVVVDNLPLLLSESQQQALEQEIPACDSPTEEWMISTYTIAKRFAHQSCP